MDPVYEMAIAQPKKMLLNLSAWLEKAEAHAQSRDAAPESLLSARLAFDQFALVRQVQSACDGAKFIASRLGGAEAPKHEDNETSMHDLLGRIRSVVAVLDAVDAKALEGYEERKITVSFLPEGKWLRGQDYLCSFALPNFYFHVTTAYAILRHVGVSLGKRDFLGHVPIQGD